MEENPDDYSGPSAYIYNKPPDNRDKRSQPYRKQFRKFRRWPLQQLAKCLLTQHEQTERRAQFLCLGQRETVICHEKSESNPFDL